jgi:hypothetical protein
MVAKLLHRFVVPIRSVPIAIGLSVALIVPTRSAQGQGNSSPRYENGFTLYGGYRFGGSVTDTTNDAAIDLGSGSSFALAGDIGLDYHRQIELLYSQQRTSLSHGAFSSQASNRGLTLHNYQIGGTNFIDETGRGLYVMGGLGGTTATPDQVGLNSETFFSGNLGIGWMVPLGVHVGIKFEARGYGILLNHNGALFCGGNSGCTIAVKGSALFEGEVLAGLAARF